MNILFLAYRPECNASSRYRIYKFLPYLRRNGIACKVLPPYGDKLYERLIRSDNRMDNLVPTAINFLNRLHQVPRVPKYGIVVIQQELLRYGPPIFEKLVKYLNPRIIFDFDDANFALETITPASKKSRFYQYDKTSEIIRMSRHVIAGNKFLEDYALKLNSNVTVIPTCIDVERYLPKDHRMTDKPVIGWVGTPAGLSHLDFMEDVYEELSKRHQFCVKIVCNRPYQFRSVNTTFTKWKLDEEVSQLRSFDIGIMPVPDTPFTRGKCAFKAIQYMGVAVPPVCSPVGANIEIVRDGETGFLARSKEEWVEKLSLLIRDVRLRETIGLSGRRMVEQQMSIESNVPKLIDVIEKVTRNS